MSILTVSWRACHLNQATKRKENVGLVSYVAEIVLFPDKFKALLVPFKVTDAVEKKIDLFHTRVLSYGL
jgi:hypothetical protein